MTPAELSIIVRRGAEKVFGARGLDAAALPDSVVIERPRNPEHGDYATNVVLQVAKRVGVAPRELAQALAEELETVPELAQVEVAGPGFLNLRLDAGAQGQIVAGVLTAAEAYGRGDSLAGTSVNVEFVSANPTGPIHLGGTRWAAVGGALCELLRAQGAQVTREYYFNDHGEQINHFAASLAAAATGQEPPEKGYKGEYIVELAGRIVAETPGLLALPEAERLETFRARGTELMFAHIKQSLHEFGTDFDVFFHENSLFESGAVEAAIAQLKDNGNLYEADGAWWLRSSEFGDDKDRVVIKSDGNAAYIAGDIAYIRDKRERGADLCIYLLGADHHGYIARLKAAAQALGYSGDSVEVLIGQMVNLVRDGQPVRMSKRAGTVVTLDDLVEAVGVDAARYAMVRSSVDSSLDIDLALWTSQSSDNPVYYVQYAHARLCSLARKAQTVDPDLFEAPEAAPFAQLTEPREGDLVRTLGEFPRVVAAAAELREPHRVARYLEELAGVYHRFYDVHPVLPAGGEATGGIHRARFALSLATRQVLRNGLGLIGVSAPEQM